MKSVDTLDDAIERSKGIIEVLEQHGDAAEGERQLLDWLMELQNFKEGTS